MKLRIASSRRGVSLTELLLLMSAHTAILSMCAVLLHSVMRVGIDARSFVDAERTSGRLSRQFRQDVHQASAAVVGGSTLKSSVFLQLRISNDETVEYSQVNGKISRTVLQSGKARACEEFAFEPSCKLMVRQIESPKRLVLSITSPALESTMDQAEQLKSYKAVPVGLNVEASVNRDATSIKTIAEQERVK